MMRKKLSETKISLRRYGRYDGVVMLGYLIGLAMSSHLYKLGGNYLCYVATALTTGTAIFHLWAIGDKGILEENKLDIQNEEKKEVKQMPIDNWFMICLEEKCHRRVRLESLQGIRQSSDQAQERVLARLSLHVLLRLRHV